MMMTALHKPEYDRVVGPLPMDIIRYSINIMSKFEQIVTCEYSKFEQIVTYEYSKHSIYAVLLQLALH